MMLVESSRYKTNMRQKSIQGLNFLINYITPATFTFYSFHVSFTLSKDFTQSKAEVLEKNSI